MRLEEIRPTDVEITTTFTLSELKHLHFVLSNAIIREDNFEQEQVEVYKQFFEFVSAIVKES